MFEIDYGKLNQKPNLFICKPDNNLSIVGKLNDAYNVNINLKLSQINELSFSLPYYVDIDHNYIKNPNIDLLKYGYLIKFVLNDYIEYFIINIPEDNSDEESMIKNITCYSYAYTLNNEIITYSNEDTTSSNATQILTTILQDTAWTVGVIEAEFDIMYRQFSFTSQTALDCIYDIANTFSGLITFDTVNLKVNLYNIDNFGLDRGLEFKYGKYIQTINNTINPDNFATRLYIYGKDNVSINEVNINGSPYIENLQYFLYPFERDQDKIVLKHSDFMSDSLCNALLDYNILTENNELTFSNLLTQKTNLQTILTTKENEKINLTTEMYVILDNLDIAQANNQDTAALIIERNNKQIEIDNKKTEINSVLFNINVTTLAINTGVINFTIDDKSFNISVTIGDSVNTIATNINNYINNNYYNINNNYPLYSTFKCSVVNNIVSVIYFSTKDYADIDMVFTDTEITGVNCIFDNKLNNGIQNQISNINNQNNVLFNLLSLENNFTAGQLLELKRSFVIKKIIRNEYISDPQQLLTWGKKEFEKFYYPPVVIQLKIIDLFRCIDVGCQYDRDKLQLGENVRVKYDHFKVDIKAKIIEISYDFENFDVDISISNIKEINKDKDKFLEMLNKSISTSNELTVNKDNWNNINSTNNQLMGVIEQLRGNASEEINLSVNNSVQINKRGITIFNEDNPNNLIRMTSGVIGLSKNGGNEFSTAISPEGVINEKIISKIIKKFISLI